MIRPLGPEVCPSHFLLRNRTSGPKGHNDDNVCAGDKSPAYHEGEFFRTLFNRVRCSSTQLENLLPLGQRPIDQATPSTNPYDSHGCVVGLVCERKLIHRVHDGLDHVAGGIRIAFGCCFTEALGAPFAMSWVERFNHSICI